jgi:hypothetical protein
MSDTITKAPAIAAAIEESRERESKATPGPWGYLDRGPVKAFSPEEQKQLSRTDEFGGTHTPVNYELFHESQSSVQRFNDGAFAANSRTMEPRFCEALAEAVKFMVNIPHVYGCGYDEGEPAPDECAACESDQKLARIEQILKGGGK